MLKKAPFSAGLVHKSSWTRHIDPGSKFLLMADTIAASMVFSSLSVNLGLILCLLMLNFSAHILHKSLVVLAFSLFLISTMLLIQGLFYAQNQTPIFTIGWLTFYQEGLQHAALLAGRILIITLSACLLMFTMTIGENTIYLEKLGLPFRYVYALMSVCYILPQMHANMRRIQLAQQARGVVGSGRLRQRFRAILPTLIPLIVMTLTRTINRSIALRLRGFESKQRQTPNWQYTYIFARGLHYLLFLGLLALLGGVVWL
ncbi:energy-coupling factor transporter transmembrane protein EcfT [Lactobacillus sp. CC-MHH1034]|uniref:energy-coupling factor transporter transmembrane component T n=1 Tax=Agrilactobacillus fermenti TaxID=2586909 RepID=UPI001E514A80|nr:energy-coupling factor transporter transmembrane component T [Agrilactobacillus fermenti]MCD2256027.1 energy-coupling factor transporter transmembrane protein EcfT [Agrilactobacillus fermenti]